jgi:hypothetical protein
MKQQHSGHLQVASKWRKTWPRQRRTRQRQRIATQMLWASLWVIYSDKMQPCLVKEKDQGSISAIEDVKSFLAKKVDDAKETLTQGQQNLARELKTPFKANPTAMSLLDVTTSPAPTHRFVLQTPVRVHVPAQGLNFCKCKVLCDFHLFPPIYSSHLMSCRDQWT